MRKRWHFEVGYQLFRGLSAVVFMFIFSLRCCVSYHGRLGDFAAVDVSECLRHVSCLYAILFYRIIVLVSVGAGVSTGFAAGKNMLVVFADSFGGVAP